MGEEQPSTQSEETGPLIDQMLRSDFILLAEPESSYGELVLGTVGQFWEPEGGGAPPKVLGPEEFNQNVEFVDTDVSLDDTNELSVELRGKPGGVIVVRIVGVDEDPPTITASVDPPPNLDGWHNSDVTVTFTCDDVISGVQSCSEPVVLSAEGADQVVTGVAVDFAQNTSEDLR